MYGLEGLETPVGRGGATNGQRRWTTVPGHGDGLEWISVAACVDEDNDALYIIPWPGNRIAQN